MNFTIIKKGTREMNALELADEIMEHYKAELPRGFNINWMKEAATMLRQQHAYKDVLTNIANDYPELSHDKARMQNLDHIKLAKDVLK